MLRETQWNTLQLWIAVLTSHNRSRLASLAWPLVASYHVIHCLWLWLKRWIFTHEQWDGICTWVIHGVRKGIRPKLFPMHQKSPHCTVCARLILSDVIKTFFQDQDKDQDLLWCLLDADRKVFFIFGRKRNCRRKWNSIYGRKWNENENWHSFSAEMRQRKSPDNISVFFLFHTFSHQVSPTMRRQYLVQFRLFCRWSLLMWFHFPYVQCIDIFVAFSRWHFNPWTVCFPGLLLPSESNLPQSMHCALLASVWPNK